jgi:tetratricopeptide (TPR) repeat protein
MSNGDVGVYLHTLRLGDASANALRHTRLLDLTQRYMLRGRYDYPLNPADLVSEQPDDPMGALLAAYLWQRRGERDRALSFVTRLIERDPDWSDLHAIHGEILGRGDESAALDAYKRALDSGIPIFAGGLARLWQAVTRLDLQHPNRSVLAQIVANRVPGLLWTALTSLPKR